MIIDPDADTADEIMELAQAWGADEVYPMSNGELLVLSPGPCAPAAALIDQIRPYQDGANLLIVLARA